MKINKATLYRGQSVEYTKAYIRHGERKEMPLNPSQVATLRKEKDVMEAAGFRQVRRIANKVLVKTIQTYRRGFDITDVLTTTIDEVRPLIVDAMVAADIMGKHRSLLVAGQELGKDKKAFGPYDWAKRFVKGRLNLTESQTQAIGEKYGSIASQVTSRMSDHAEQAARKAMEQIISQGMHIPEGTAYLRNALMNVGIQGNKPWLFETLVRTQIHVAYGAGRWNAAQDPDIQEILWGWEYVAIDDDRVREEHLALNGTTLPKDDPRWREIWPPNGYNCRCDVIEVFEQSKPVEPPATVETDDGKILRVGADDGWGVNFGMIYPDTPLVSA
jgi:SPP1 gp7 family putative phage head morphogenesis protein